MAHPVDKGMRKRIRYFKGMRRVRERLNGHTCGQYCMMSDGCQGEIQRTSWWCEKHPRDGHGKRFAQLADHPQVCSCDGCGNQRHAWGGPYPTRQERWAELRERIEVHEADPGLFHPTVSADGVNID